MNDLSIWQEASRYSVEMADYGAGSSLGSRIAAARRARGHRSPQDFARALEGTGITAAVIMNIESGRKIDLTVSQVLNIAKVLGVPLSGLLAPMARPGDVIDLPGLGASFADMSAGEFDAWLSSIPNADYVATTAEERGDRAELQAFREHQSLRRELDRLRVVVQIEGQNRPTELAAAMDRRIAAAEFEISKLREFLTSAGWIL